jgi:cytoskeletal protein CcmA (bactofilin family)
MFKVKKTEAPGGNPTNQTPANAGAPPTNAQTSAPIETHQPLQNTMYAPSNNRALTETESLARDIKEGTLNGFVGAGTVLSGEVTFKGMLRVDGQVTGHITSEGGTLIVSAGGQVDANVDVAVAVISGIVNGDVTANKKIELGRSAKVSGNLQTPALVIEQGAIFEGTCRMQHLREATERYQPERDGRASSAPNIKINALEAAEKIEP